MNVRLYQEALLRLVYPVQCGICRRSLEIRENHLCRDCRAALQSQRLTASELLADHPFESIDQAWSLYRYDSPAKPILTAIKFLRHRWLLNVFSEDLSYFAAAILTETGYDFLTPVPIDRARLSERHFNQSEILSGMLSKHSLIPISNALRKTHSTPAQSRLNQKERRANLYGVFSVRTSDKVAGKRILLVDDILTTGATADEAARVLKNAGAKSVDLFTIARTAQNAPLSDANDFKIEDGILAGLFS